MEVYENRNENWNFKLPISVKTQVHIVFHLKNPLQKFVNLDTNLIANILFPLREKSEFIVLPCGNAHLERPI